MRITWRGIVVTVSEASPIAVRNAIWQLETRYAVSAFEILEIAWQTDTEVSALAQGAR